MPGSVIRVAVAVGDTVTAGQPLLWMEAMKMEHTIAAAVDGVVSELPVEVGTQVESGTILAVVVDPDTDPTSGDTTAGGTTSGAGTSPAPDAATEQE